MPKRGRPPVPPDQRRVTLAVRVKPGTREVIEERAKADDISQGDVIDGWAKRSRKTTKRARG